jgi:hypothetical protein
LQYRSFTGNKHWRRYSRRGYEYEKALTSNPAVKTEAGRSCKSTARGSAVGVGVYCGTDLEVRVEPVDITPRPVLMEVSWRILWVLITMTNHLFCLCGKVSTKRERRVSSHVRGVSSPWNSCDTVT